MEAATYRLNGSEFVGAFATATDRYVFCGASTQKKSVEVLEEVLKAKAFPIMVSDSSLIGLLAKANSNGIVLSNLAFEYEVERIKSLGLGINVGVLESDLNAIGSNILANDKIAIINPDYTASDANVIGDILGVEVVKRSIAGLKTVGANNVLTNKGMAVNNRIEEDEKKELDKITGFDSIRTTANKGSISIGLSVIANSNSIVVGSETTGYELDRLLDALEH
ncbi:MAG: translation initiation factor IF-6 [Candidatus Micrarchaeia archaeon]